MENYEIDATGKKLGRIASEAARVLQGKNTPAYAPNKVGGQTVKIKNASKADISAKKYEEKEYVTYSGFPGGIKRTSLDRVVKKHGFSELFVRAVYGMLPANKLRSKRMKKLEVTE